MKAISKGLVESLANANSMSFAMETERKVTNLVSFAADLLGSSMPFVSVDNCLLQPVNETFNGAVTPESKYIYFLAFNSPQIEVNCLQYNDSWKKFKERVEFAWNSSKKPKRRKRKNKKKAAEAEENKIAFSYDENKYNMDSLKDDLQKALVQNLTETSVVYNLEKALKIVGRDDFGPKVQIYLYPCLLEGKNFKFFISRKKGFFTINFENREKLLNQKIDKVGNNFIKILKVFNSLYNGMSRGSAGLNQLFIESVLYNTPDELFEGDDIYEVLFKIVNFINLTDVSKFKSILNPNITIVQDRACKVGGVQFLKFLASLSQI